MSLNIWGVSSLLKTKAEKKIIKSGFPGLTCASNTINANIQWVPEAFCQSIQTHYDAE